MRNFFLLIFILITATNIFSAEFWGEVKSEYRIENLEESRFPLEAKLGTEFSEDDFYSQFAIIGESTESEEGVDVYRAHVELYKDNLTLSIGRQKLVWGSAFIFNLTDVFNPVDIEDPRSEKVGTDSIRLKYNTTAMSRLEAVAFKNDLSNNNFGSRYTFLSGDFEFMLNYLNYKQSVFDSEETRRNDLIFEFKGDVEVGLWAQLEQYWEDSDSGTTAVIGTDYTFDVMQKTLYTLAEGVYDFGEKAAAVYLMYKYDFSDLASFNQSALINPKGGSFFISSYISYIFNDYVTTKTGVNFYNDMEQFGFETSEGKQLDNELFLEMKLFF